MPAFQPEISGGSQEVPGPKLGLDTHDPPLPLFGVRREECNRRGTPIATLRLVADAPDRSGASAMSRRTRRIRRQVSDARREVAELSPREVVRIRRQVSDARREDHRGSEPARGRTNSLCLRPGSRADADYATLGGCSQGKDDNLEAEETTPLSKLQAETGACLD